MKEEHVKICQKAVKYFALALAIFLTVSIIGSIISSFGSVFGIFGGTSLGEIETYDLSGEVRSLQLEVAAAELKITEAESFSVKSNISDLEVNLTDGTLRIKEKKRFFGYYNDAVLEIVIPQGFSFESATITLGAGDVNIDTLSVERLDLELGAGKAVIGGLYATRFADIDGGAGELNINGGAICDLDFDMGVGECNLRFRMSGDCDLDMGVGEANVTLLGSESDYKIEFTTGLGAAAFNGKSVEDGQIFGNGSCQVEISGGIGELNVLIEAE